MRTHIVLTLTLLLGAAGCAMDPADPAGATESLLDDPVPVLFYPRSLRVPQNELMEIDGSAIGGEIVAGQPRAFIRVDYANGPMLGGIFQTTRGTVRVRFPFTEHATILNGLVIVTDEGTGESRRMTTGDSYVIEAGTVVLWETVTPFAQKSFLNIAPID